MRSSCGISVADDARRRVARHPRRSTLVFTDGPGWRQLTWRSCRLTDRALARAFGGLLDRRLAAGRSPESARLLAARAQDLVSRATRQALADDWEYVLDRAKHAPAPTLGKMALHRDWIVVAEPEVREIAACLRTPLPVAAAGVAAASVLLTDGAGPLYNPRARLGLRDALRLAIAQLDPSVSLFASP
jgi:hypothetical protein